MINLKHQLGRKIVQSLVLVLGFMLSSQLRAQPVSEAKQSEPVGFSSGNPATGIEDVAFSLAIVLVLIFVLAWLVKRFAPGGGRIGSRHMRVLSTLPLGSKERLMLVDAAGTQMVIGVSPAGIECLHVFDEAVIDIGEAKAVGSDVNFAKILQGFKAKREEG